MNIIYELGLQGRNTILLIPSNIPTAGMTTTAPGQGPPPPAITTVSAPGQGPLPPVGILGINELKAKSSTDTNSEQGYKSTG